MLWVVRNLLVSGTATGSRLPWTLATLSNNLDLFFHAWLDWLAPSRIGSKMTLTGSPLVDVLLLIGVVCGLLILYTRSAASQGSRTRLRLGLLLVLLFAIYTAVVQFSASLVNFSNDAGRVAAPLVPLVILLILLGLESGSLWLDAHLPRRIGSLLLVALAAAWLIFPAQKIFHEFGILTSSDGWLGFSSQAVRTSPLVAWEQPDQMVDPLYTNLDDPICINRGRFIQTISAVDPQLAEQQLLDSDVETLTLIIFAADGRRRMSYSIDSFADQFEIEPLVTLEDETGIYRLTRRG
ncbi:MAG: hypothetical protein K8J31_23060 [Anaerolineae bacterium]|nr:hypothetical protein [Anaerolineae bacterium]